MRECARACVCGVCDCLCVSGAERACERLYTGAFVYAFVPTYEYIIIFINYICVFVYTPVKLC